MSIVSANIDYYFPHTADDFEKIVEREWEKEKEEIRQFLRPIMLAKLEQLKKEAEKETA